MNILFIQFFSCIRNYKYAYNLTKKGHNVYLLSPNPPPMGYYHLKENPYRSYMQKEITNNNISDLITKWDIDAIHFHNRPDYPMDLLSKFGIPVVYDIHDPLLIPIQKLENVVYVVVSKPMIKVFCKNDEKRFVVPPIMLHEPKGKPIIGGKGLYMSSFYWKWIVPKIVKVLRDTTADLDIDIDIYSASKTLWEDIKREIKHDIRLNFKGVLSLDTFENTEYEFGISESITDPNQNSYRMPVKIVDYLSLGLTPMDIGPGTYLSERISLGKYDLTEFQFDTYYKTLMSAYRGKFEGE